MAFAVAIGVKVTGEREVLGFDESFIVNYPDDICSAYE